jgi:hypothetical protein
MVCAKLLSGFVHNLILSVLTTETCFDDPGLMGGIVPWDVIANPRKMRWGICEQGICFGKGVMRQGFAGLGQVKPYRSL